uniref:Pyrin domain-containing protein n=1 Tax=Oreochromis aureus TaxID=47969 RepID=A0A668VW76_OREAU
MQVPELLLEKLQDLTNDDYKTFKWYLTMKIVDSCKPFPRSKLEGQDRMDTVSCMIDSYGETMAVKVSVAILRKMNVNNIADDLQGKFEATMSAHQGGMVIAPTFTGSSTGPVNITIHQK